MLFCWRIQYISIMVPGLFAAVLVWFQLELLQTMDAPETNYLSALVFSCLFGRNIIHSLGHNFFINTEGGEGELYSDTLYYTFLSHTISTLFQSETAGIDVAVYLSCLCRFDW